MRDHAAAVDAPLGDRGTVRQDAWTAIVLLPLRTVGVLVLMCSPPLADHHQFQDHDSPPIERRHGSCGNRSAPLPLWEVGPSAPLWAE